MCLEALKSVKTAEEEARLTIAIAQRNAAQMIEEASQAGKESVASTLSRAESEISHLRHYADKKAAEQAMELASTTANRQAALRARAERRLDAAAQLIVERILNTK